MGAGSFLASLARHPHRSARQPSKVAAAVVHDIDCARPAGVSPAQLADGVQPAGALQLLSSFHVDLAERLQQLQLLGTGDAHLNWLLDALASTLSTHTALQLALSSTAANSSSSSAASAAARHRADEVLSMLDVCAALKHVTDDMRRQFGCLQDAIQSVRHALNSEKPLPSGRFRTAARRLSACLKQDQPHTNILGITHNRYRPLAEARTSLCGANRELQNAPTPLDPAATLLCMALDGALLTSLLVLASAVSSLAPPSRRKSTGIITSACKMITKYLGAKRVSAPWATPLRQLHRDLQQEEMTAAGGSLFRELQCLHSAATQLHATITTPAVHSIELAGLKQSVESLRKRLREAQACVSMLHMQIACLSQALIALRLALLDML